MDFKEALTDIEGLENGADIITAIKAETARLNAEAKGHREKGEATAAQLAQMMQAAGIADGTDPLESIRAMKTTLDGFQAGGKKPEEVAAKLADLTKRCETMGAQLAEVTKRADTERARRYNTMKQAAAVDALLKGNAANPQAMAKLITDSITIDEGEKLGYQSDSGTVSVEDGVAAWLKANPWAVKTTVQNGGGAPTGGTDAKDDPFLKGFGE